VGGAQTGVASRQVGSVLVNSLSTFVGLGACIALV
jgi:hypothetical protein